MSGTAILPKLLKLISRSSRVQALDHAPPSFNNRCLVHFMTATSPRLTSEDCLFEIRDPYDGQINLIFAAILQGHRSHTFHRRTYVVKQWSSFQVKSYGSDVKMEYFHSHRAAQRVIRIFVGTVYVLNTALVHPVGVFLAKCRPNG